MAEFVSPFDTDLFMTNQVAVRVAIGLSRVPHTSGMGGLLAFACKSEGGSLSLESSFSKPLS